MPYQLTRKDNIMAKTMRRWEIDAIGRDRLSLREIPVPAAGPRQVLVKVAAVALNHRDKMVVESGRGLPLAFPLRQAPTWPAKSSRQGLAPPASPSASA